MYVRSHNLMEDMKGIYVEYSSLVHVVPSEETIMAS
jgi:hypothetical protein